MINEKLAERYLEQGIQEKRNGNYSKSLECYNKANNYFPKNPAILISRAKVLYILGKYVESQHDYIDAIGISGELDQNTLAHLGHAIVDKNITSNMHGGLAEEYRKQIDPYFRTNGKKKYSVQFTDNDFRNYDIKCFYAAYGIFKKD